MVGELTAEIIGNNSELKYTKEEQDKLLAYAKIAAASVTAYLGGNANTAVDTAHAAVINNYLSDWQKKQEEKEIQDCSNPVCEAYIYAKWTAISVGQDASFAGGMVIGVPEQFLDVIKGVIDMALSPVQTYDVIADLLRHDNTVAIIGEALKQSYLDKVNRLKTHYQRAGAGGSFNAGREAGQLLGEIATSVTLVSGAPKAGITVVNNIKKVAKVTADQGKRVQNYSVFNKVVDEIDHIAIATEGGFINAAKVCKSACVLKPTSEFERTLVADIIKHGDKSGIHTEKLINNLASRSGYTPLKGGKYGSNNGFDHVLLGKDGAVVIIDSKQIRNGAVQVSPKGAGGKNQLSSDWIKAVANNLHNGDPVKAIVINAIDRKETIKTLIVGVDKSDSTIKLIPVQIPN